MKIAVLSNIEDRHDVGVSGEPSRKFGFLPEPIYKSIISCELRMKQLDGDVATQSRIARAINR